jgi:aminocarboxymuconate-semialdehyde decarboxylase
MTAAIDLHCHIFPEPWLDLVRRDGERVGARLYRRPDGRLFLQAPGDFDYPVGEELWSVPHLVEAMERRGLTGAALSVAPPTLSYWAAPDVAAELAARANDGLADVVRRHPDRFVALATVPLQDMDRAVRELERCLRRPEFRGVLIGSHVGDRNLDDPYFTPLWEAAEALDACVFVHPYQVLGSERLQRYYLWNTIGMVTETALAIASLIFGGVYARFPRLRTYFAHGGGTFPWIRGRIEHAFHRIRSITFPVDRPPSAFLDRIYVDNMCFLPSALAWLVRELGADHVAVGSDYPFDIGPDDPTEIVRAAGLDAAAQEQVIWRTAAHLLRLPAGALGTPAAGAG